MVGFVNVKTDYRARATTVRFSSRELRRRSAVRKRGASAAPFCSMLVGGAISDYWLSCSEATFQSSARVWTGTGPGAPGGMFSDTTSRI